MEADLGVVILRHEVEQVRQQDVGLIASHAVEALGEAAVDIQGLPARDR